MSNTIACATVGTYTYEGVERPVSVRVWRLYDGDVILEAEAVAPRGYTSCRFELANVDANHTLGDAMRTLAAWDNDGIARRVSAMIDRPVTVDDNAGAWWNTFIQWAVDLGDISRDIPLWAISPNAMA